jgi:hypothetical protein
MRAIRAFALLGGVLVGCGGSAARETTDASVPPSPTSPATPAAPGEQLEAIDAHAAPLKLARALARPDRAVGDVLGRGLALAPEGAGLVVSPRAAGDLALHVPARADAEARVGADEDHALTLAIEGASPTPVERDGGAAIHRAIAPGTDAVWAATEARAELLFVLRDEHAPTRFRLRLGRGRDLTAPLRDDEGLAFRDGRGRIRLRIPTPIALDANGARRAAEMTLEDDGRALAIALDTSGLAFPVLLDPAITQGRWTAIGDRGKRTMASLAWDTSRKKLLAFGGYIPGSNSEPGGASGALAAYTFPGRTFDGLAGGPMGFTSAMLGSGGGGAYQEYGWSASFDAARGKLVAIGSSQWDCSTGCTTTYRMQTYEWDSATDAWTQRCTGATCAASAPGATQRGIENVYDASRKVSIVCNRSSQSCAAWNGATADGTWTPLPAFPSTSLWRGFYDATYGAATFLGGDGTYSWNGSAWVKRTSSTLYPLGVTYDTIRKRAVAITGNGLNADTYEWDGSAGAWTLIAAASASTPYNKDSVAMGFDPVNGRVVVWGGGVGEVGYYSFDFISTLFEYQAFGNACAGDIDCEGGSCRDGFCCDAKCGACQRCDGPGNGGVCAAFAGAASTGTEHDTCTGTNACDPSGACKKKKGQACAAGSECVSGACVDGVCCASACNQACEVCNATPGTCTAAPKGSSGRGSCGVGACDGTSHVCSTSCTTDADCSATGWCKAGTCTATQAPGGACARDRQCQSGSCRDGVCCDKACNGACEACTKAKGATADGTCTTLPASAKPAACGGYACSGTSAACAASCTTDAQCASGYWCDGAFCQATRAQGDSCTRGGQCAAGLTCADGVCCNSACDGACQACAAAHKQSGDASGTCGPAKAGSDPGDRCPADAASTCGKSGACNATGSCALWSKGTACGGGVVCDAGAAKGQTCDGLGACVTDAAGTACAPGSCSAAAGCTFTCSSDADCDATGFCDGGACKAKASAGRTCTAADQCASGFCVDGVCCGSACDRVCEACNGVGTEGTCTAVTGAPRAGHGACAASGTGDACAAAACDGATRDACTAFAGPETTCRAAGCDNGVESLATKCDGTGACPKASTRPCAPFACKGTHCAASCASDDDCAKGNRCDVGTGTCVSRGACDGAHTVVGTDGSETECAPYRCDDQGCKSACETSEDCTSQAICDGKQCVLVPAASSDGGGCAATGGAQRGGSGASFAGLAGFSTMFFAAIAARRRAARKGAR